MLDFTPQLPMPRGRCQRAASSPQAHFAVLRAVPDLREQAMRKPKVHKLYELQNWKGELTTLGFAKCGEDVWARRSYCKTWRGVPLTDRCKKCLRVEAKGKR